MRRTTIFADDDLLEEIKGVARQSHKSTAEVIREALRQYLEKRSARKRTSLSFIGIGESGKDNISEKHEELLWQRPSKPKQS